jgi:AraC-like DNA-binding protein
MSPVEVCGNAQAIQAPITTAAEHMPSIILDLPPWQTRCIEAYIAIHLHRPITLKELDHRLQLHIPGFGVAFKQTFRCTLRQYVMRRRVKRAQRLLLETDDSLRDVARACGYSEEGQFTNRFRRVMGECPASWRRKHRMGSS